jgi:uncharacterized membrane protein YqjE
MLDSLRGFAQTLVGALRTRLLLFANELEEQGARIAQMAALWALAGFCLALAVVLGAVLLVVLFWDTHRVEVLAFLTGLFAAGGIGAALVARALARARPKAFASTLAELAVDHDALGSGAAGPAP